MPPVRKKPWLWTQKTSRQISAGWPGAQGFPHHTSGSPSVNWVHTYLQGWEGRFQTVKCLAWSKGSKKCVHQLSQIFSERTTENSLNAACGRNSCAGWDCFPWPWVPAKFQVRAGFCFRKFSLTCVVQDEVVAFSIPARLGKKHPLRWWESPAKNAEVPAEDDHSVSLILWSPGPFYNHNIPPCS